ncbi:MAG TPA: nucleotidyltransferase domain-containing protein [Thermomicrobiales bacterium]|nr:nucleotidyltransferase domain-containing protein [Thermomicrobiales bacterium]
MATSQAIDQDVLDDIVQRIVRIADPDRILLFGSQVWGEETEERDFNLLVIKGGEYHRRQLMGKIRLGLYGIDHAVDVIVATPGDIERYGNSPALVLAPAIREGREIYAK